jgi:hypothetical protein
MSEGSRIVEDAGCPRRALARRDPLFLALLGLAFLVRFLYALPPHVCFGDESCYLWLARNLFEGQGYTYYNQVSELHFPPLFPISLGIIHFFVRDWAVVSRVAFVVFGGLTVIPVFLLGREMYGRRAGLLAASLAAVLPALTSGVLFAETLSEPLYLLCLFTGLHLVYRSASTKGLFHFALAGAALSLACLTRPEAMLYLFTASFFLAVVLFWEKSPGFLPSVGRLAALAGAFLLVAAPYVLYLHAETGRWTLTLKSSTSYTTTRGLVSRNGKRDLVAFQKDTWGLNDKGEVKYFAHEHEKGLLQLLSGPYRERILPDIKCNLWSVRNVMMRHSFFGRVLLALVLLGLAGSPWVRSRFRAEAWNLLMFPPVFPVLVFFINERFLYALLLPLVLWAGLGLDHLLSWIRDSHLPGRLGSRRSRAFLQGLLLAGILGGLLKTGFTNFLEKSAPTIEVWQAAAWLKENTPEDAVVMSTGPEVSFHAGRRWLPLPVAPRKDVVAYGLARGATHLCLRGHYLPVRPEQKAELFDAAKNHEDLELLVKLESEPSGPAFVVYRLKRPPGPGEPAGGPPAGSPKPGSAPADPSSGTSAGGRSPGNP